MGFKAWLNQQVDRDDSVGDLARDAKRDGNWPKGRASLRRLRAYLESRQAMPGALDALEQAWREYGRHTGRA
jgi:uncharacterized protein YozE (UPF0346 family)